MSQITARQTVPGPQFTIGTSLGASSVCPYDRSDAAIRLLSGSTTTVTVYGSDEEGGTYRQLRVSGSALAALAVSTSFDEELPNKYFKYGWLKFVGDAAGVGKLIAKA